jgi:hypothetical protein
MRVGISAGSSGSPARALYRFLGPKGELRADGEKLIKRNGKNGARRDA